MNHRIFPFLKILIFALFLSTHQINSLKFHSSSINQDLTLIQQHNDRPLINTQSQNHQQQTRNRDSLNHDAALPAAAKNSTGKVQPKGPTSALNKTALGKPGANSTANKAGINKPGLNSSIANKPGLSSAGLNKPGLNSTGANKPGSIQPPRNRTMQQATAGLIPTFGQLADFSFRAVDSYQTYRKNNPKQDNKGPVQAPPPTPLQQAAPPNPGRQIPTLPPPPPPPLQQAAPPNPGQLTPPTQIIRPAQSSHSPFPPTGSSGQANVCRRVKKVKS